jgi:hypothetical protein
MDSGVARFFFFVLLPGASNHIGRPVTETTSLKSNLCMNISYIRFANFKFVDRKTFF